RASAAPTARRLLRHRDDVGAHRRFGNVARGRRIARIDMEAAVEEILRRLAIALERLGAGLGDADELQESRAVWIAVLAELVHLSPEAAHRFLAELIAEIAEIGVDVIHLGAPLPRLDRAAARNPDRRTRLLHRLRPDIDVALLVVAAVEAERVLARPGLHHEVVRLAIA